MKVIQPLNGYLLIKPRPAEQAIAGIEIPESVDKEKANVGTVVIGNTVKVTGQEISKIEGAPITLLDPGTVVLFNAFSPRKVQHEGEECLLVNGEDIYAVIEA